MSHNRFAIIDLGTNTCNLLIGNIDDRCNINFIYRDRAPVMLGCEEGLVKGVICGEAIYRVVVAIKKYMQIIHKYNVENNNILIFATEGVRNANNSADLLSRIRLETGLKVRIISGDDEAEWIYYGVKNSGLLKDRVTLIMDIGGGSTEFIIADKDKFYWKHSFKLGASRLLQIIKPQEPFSYRDLIYFIRILKQELVLLTKQIKKYKPRVLIGTSGSFHTLSNAILKQIHNMKEVPKSNFYSVDKEDFSKIYCKIVRATLEELLNMPGIEPYRAKYMPISVIFIKFVMKYYNIKALTYSGFGIKEGAAYKLMCNEA